MGIIAGTTDIRLEDEMDYVPTIPAGESYWSTSGCLVVGESEGNDILFLTFFFRFGGKQPGIWLVDKTSALYTTFLAVPQDQRGKMHNNDFIGNRSFGTEWSEDVQILKEKDRVIWQLGKCQHICRPPYWELRGEHLGVECNLTIAARSNASWLFGPWKNLALSGSQAGYEMGCWAEGTITVGGKTYTLENGYACREQITLGQTWDIPKVLSREEYYCWGWCFSEAVQIFVCQVPFMGYRISQVVIDGQEVPFEHPQITFDEMDWWIDPKTHMRVPSRWHLNINSENGVVDAIVVAYARTCYSYASETGVSIQYEILSRSNGRVFLRDGRSIPINDAVSTVDIGWPAVPLESGAPVKLPLEAPAE